LPSVVRVNQAPGTGVAKALFIRNDTGGLNVCAVTSAAVLLSSSFIAGDCVGGAAANTPLILDLRNADQHTSRVQVDPSGLAKRVN
jgi:hypothetical protein